MNCSGVWQSQAGAAAPVGEARPGWKILRVLGNLLNLTGFEYSPPKRCSTRCARAAPTSCQPLPGHARGNGGAAEPHASLVDVPMYQCDAVVRRAPSLQRTREGRTPGVAYDKDDPCSRH